MFYDASGLPLASCLVVLDAKGIIRAKRVRGDSLDKAIDELLVEMEAPAPPARQGEAK